MYVIQKEIAAKNCMDMFLLSLNLNLVNCGIFAYLPEFMRDINATWTYAPIEDMNKFQRDFFIYLQKFLELKTKQSEQHLESVFKNLICDK